MPTPTNSHVRRSSVQPQILHAAARGQDRQGAIADAADGFCALPDKERLLDKAAVCRMFGGNRPLNPSTLYRQIKAGRFPKPIRIGGSSRWLRDECEAVLRRMMEARS